MIWHDVWKLGCFWVLTGVTLAIGGITLFLHDRLVFDASTVTTTFWVLYLANAIILGMAGNTFRSETIGSRGYRHVLTLTAPGARQGLGVYMKSIQADRPATQLKMPEWAAPTHPLSAGIVSIAERESIGVQDRNHCRGRHANATKR